jgi:hypothetical protein
MPTDTDLDAVDLLRALRPGIDAAFDPDSPTARAQLERILDAPMPTPAARHRRAPTRRIAIATAAAAALAAGTVAVSPFAGGSPDVVAKAAAALTEPNTILHYKTQLLGAESDRLGTTEGWETSDGQRKRMLVGDVEIAEDDGARSYLTYDAEHNVIRRLTDPGFFNAPSGGVDATSPFWDPSDIGDLAQLLHERAAATTRSTSSLRRPYEGSPPTRCGSTTRSRCSPAARSQARTRRRSPRSL